MADKKGSIADQINWSRDKKPESKEQKKKKAKKNALLDKVRGMYDSWKEYREKKYSTGLEN